jgi:hypothetical protein
LRTCSTTSGWRDMIACCGPSVRCTNSRSIINTVCWASCFSFYSRNYIFCAVRKNRWPTREHGALSLVRLDFYIMIILCASWLTDWCYLPLFPLAFFCLFFVLLKLFYRASKSSDSGEDARDYIRAEQSGRDRGECWQYYSKCPKSIFNQQDNNLYMWMYINVVKLWAKI